MGRSSTRARSSTTAASICSPAACAKATAATRGAGRASSTTSPTCSCSPRADGLDYEFQQVLARGSATGANSSYEDPRVQTIRSGGAEHVVMTYTSLPARDRAGPGGSASTGSATPTGRFALNRTSGRVIGPDGRPRQGRGRLQPARRPGRADPPDPPEHAARAVRLPRRALRLRRRLLGRPPARARAAHDHLARAGSARRRRRRPAGRRPRTACCSSTTSETPTRSTPSRSPCSTATTRPRRSPMLAEPIMPARARVGALRRRRQRRLRPGRGPASRRHDLPDVRRSRPLRRRRQRHHRRARSPPSATPPEAAAPAAGP